MERANLFTVEITHDEDDPDGYNAGYARLTPKLGASQIGGSVYELARDQSICPYHYEWGCEEWAIVIAGRPVLRHPGGEEELAPGDVVCFPEGPEGAHKLTNRHDEVVRVLLLSTKPSLAMAVYPDSGKIGVFPPNSKDSVMVRRESAVDYWDGEA